ILSSEESRIMWTLLDIQY
nr:hypothetical protein [Tanacetum cinerariifolium]